MIRVIPFWLLKNYPRNNNTKVVSTIAKHSNLSPFRLGPCQLYDGLTATNVENAWQFSKVYKQFSTDNKPNDDYFAWAKRGWKDERAHRYPMGKGARPLFSWWDGKALDYIEARKTIYGPLYARAVVQTSDYFKLKRLHQTHDLILLDYDAYDHHALGMTLTDVLNEPKRKMGHAFVLAMLLTRDKALNQFQDDWHNNDET